MKKITSIILTIILILIVSFFSFYIATELHHDCCGEDCPICILISQCEHTLKQLKESLVPFFQLNSLLVFNVVFVFSNIFYNLNNTLVSKKVRMNN